MFEPIEHAQMPRAFSTLGIASGYRATVAAAAAIVLVGWSSPDQPLPLALEAAAFSFWGTLVFLFVAVQQDLAYTKVPNWLTFPAFGAALAIATWSSGPGGLLQGLLGAAVTFAILLLPFAARAIAAGDVKALMVLGALGGPLYALGLIFWSTLMSGLLGMGILVANGGLRPLFERWSASVGATLVSKKTTYLKPAPDEAAGLAMPRSLALALGVAGYNLWGVPWA